MGVRKSVFFFLLLLGKQTIALDAVCLNYLACYNELFVDYEKLEIYHEDLEVRSASSCGSLCHERRPEALLVIAKMIEMNERLVCGCGDDAALGNRSGVMDNALFCRNCPDGDRKCGGTITVSVYRKVVDDETCDDDSYEVPSLVVATTDSVVPKSSTTLTHVPTTESYVPTTGYPLTTPGSTISKKDLIHLGCYEENQINKSLINPLYLGWPGTAIVDCVDNCNILQPNNNLYILKLLNETHLFCGCGSPDALTPPPMETGTCSRRSKQEQCQFSCPIDTYSAYSYNSASINHLIPSLLLTMFLSRLLH